MQPEVRQPLPRIYTNRRTFAIILHPDAGKTTLIEKLLLYGNAIELAGNVRARRNQRAATHLTVAYWRNQALVKSGVVLVMRVVVLFACLARQHLSVFDGPAR